MTVKQLAEQIDRNQSKYMTTGEGLETMAELTASIQQVVDDEIKPWAETLRWLCDLQNGCPLGKYEDEWTEAMTKAIKMIEEYERNK